LDKGFKGSKVYYPVNNLQPGLSNSIFEVRRNFKKGKTMKTKSTTYIYDPLYLLFLQRQDLLRLSEKSRNKKEIRKIEGILLQEAPYYLFSESSTILDN